MSTIIMLPTPAAMRASAPSGATKASGGAGDFAAVLGQADAEAGGQGGAAGDAALVTVADLVQAAAGLLGTVGGAQDQAADGELPTEGSDAAADEATDGVAAPAPTEAEGDTAVLAQVVDLARWRGGDRTAGSTGVPSLATGATGHGPSGTAASSPTGVSTVADAAIDPGAVEAPAGDEAPAAAPRPAATTTAVPEAATTAPVAATPAAAASPSSAPAPTSAPAVATVTGAPVAGAEQAVVTTAPSSGTPEVEAPAPTAPTTPSAPARPLAEQLGVRLGALRDAGPGQHVLTLRVDPESYGPVRVVAHIGAEGVRIELLGATDQAREALRAALPDLRRDLVAAGLQADLDLGSSSTRQQAGAGTELGAEGRRAGADRSTGSGDGTRGRGADAAETTHPTAPEPRAGAGRIDLLV